MKTLVQITDGELVKGLVVGVTTKTDNEVMNMVSKVMDWFP